MNALFVAWRSRSPDHQGWRPVGRLDYDGSLYRFCYTRGAQLPGFQPFQQMERLDRVYESEDLFPLFANRLLSQSRPEYEAYLRWSGFDPDHPPEPILVLGVTEGIRQTDAIEVFPCPVPDAEGCFLNKFFLHGIRWMGPPALDRIRRLNPGEPLKLMADIQNDVDRQAVTVRTDLERTMIGYVPRYLANDIWNLVEECDLDFIELVVERVNQDAPLQNRVLCRFKSCWPENFQPCSDDAFLPIPVNIPARCSS